MNIFVLHQSPRVSAQMLCDNHISKMVTESAQMLCSLFEDAPYKRTHFNHPCSIWARASWANYCWLLDHAKAMATEYQCRYGKKHRSLEAIKWCADNVSDDMFVDGQPTPFAQAMPNEFKEEDPVLAYRSYYRHKRAMWAKQYADRPQYQMRYRYTEAPKWLMCS